VCGVFGISGCEDVFGELVYGLTTLQHRGQDMAGIVTLNHTFNIKKGEGLANTVFTEKDAELLKGNIGLGHIRYSTQGRADIADAQPFTVHYPYGIAMVHNGNVTNFEQLKKSLSEEHHRHINTSNDVELILEMLSIEIGKKDLHKLSVDDIFDCVRSIQKQVEGAYATVALIANQGMLAFMDPYGIRPLLLGRKETDKGVSFAFASESSCFDHLGYDVVHDLQPGEAIFIDKNKKVHSRICNRRKQAFCIFEYIYFAKEDSILHGRLIAGEREKMGKAIAEKFKRMNIKPDIVIDVPSAAYFCAQGLAEALGVPYKRGLVKNNNAKRSFISSTQEMRETIVKRKLNPIKSVIEGKHLAVVDDSIVRGTTSKYIVQQLRDAGAKEITFVSSCPPIKHPCVYGIDMSRKSEMIAAKMNYQEIQEYIGVDNLIYPSIHDFRALYDSQSFCDACFSGEYPTKVTENLFKAIEEEKLKAHR
jgi:amidophosphoribosyltransferase